MESSFPPQGAQKRRFEHGTTPSSKRHKSFPEKRPIGHKPIARYQKHKDSGVGQNFHSVPYPLTLMPYDSWYNLHNREDPTSDRKFQCPTCRIPRTPTAHTRKLFLVAERLSRTDGIVSTAEKNQNEELNWEINYQLGILDPFVEDPIQVPGGKNSQKNQWYPYKSKFEMDKTFGLLSVTHDITEGSFKLWMSALSFLADLPDLPAPSPNCYPTFPTSRDVMSSPLQLTSGNKPQVRMPQEIEEIDLTDDAVDGHIYKYPSQQTPKSLRNDCTSPYSPHHLQNTYSSPYATQPRPARTETNGVQQEIPLRSQRVQEVMSYKTLQDFYSLLDQIERTSYVGARFLEAYADYLQNDACKSCWFKRTIEDI